MLTISEKERIRERYERAYTSQSFKALNKQVEPLLDRFETVGYFNESMLNLIKEDPIEDLFLNIYGVVGVRFAQIAFKELSEHIKKADDQTYLDIIRSWAKTNSSIFITNISEFSKKKIAGIITDAIDKGLPRAQVSKLIRANVKSINRVRARAIARTEVGKAQSFGLMTGAEATGVPYKKVWHTSFVNSRDIHKEAHGQVVDKDKPFKVGGEEMKAPKVGGSAKNVINCMCTLGFEIIEEELNTAPNLDREISLSMGEVT